MEIDVSRTVEFRRSPSRMIGLTLACLALTLAFIFGWPRLPFVIPGSFNQFFGWFSSFLFGAYFLYYSSAMFWLSQPAITVAPIGFLDRRIALEFVAWTSFEKLSVVKTRRANLFVVTIPGIEWPRLSLTLMARWNRLSNRPYGYDGLWVTTNDLDVRFHELFSIVSAYAKAYGGKVE